MVGKKDKIKKFLSSFYLFRYTEYLKIKSKNHLSTLLQIIEIDKKGRIKIT